MVLYNRIYYWTVKYRIVIVCTWQEGSQSLQHVDGTERQEAAGHVVLSSYQASCRTAAKAKPSQQPAPAALAVRVHLYPLSKHMTVCPYHLHRAPLWSPFVKG